MLFPFSTLLPAYLGASLSLLATMPLVGEPWRPGKPGCHGHCEGTWQDGSDEDLHITGPLDVQAVVALTVPIQHGQCVA